MAKTMSLPGAHLIADKLKQYLVSRGHKIETRIETAWTTETPKSTHEIKLYCARSNLLNGCPPGCDPISVGFRRGEIPGIQIGRLKRVPVRALERMLDAVGQSGDAAGSPR
jgi:hypothetical protein